MDMISKADVILALGTRLNPFSSLPAYRPSTGPRTPRSSRSI